MTEDEALERALVGNVLHLWKSGMSYRCGSMVQPVDTDFGEKPICLSCKASWDKDHPRFSNNPHLVAKYL